MISWYTNFLSDFLSNYGKDKNNKNEDDNSTCKHKYKTQKEYYIICCDCGLYLERIFIADGYNWSTYKVRRKGYHSTRSYFIKNLEDLDLVYDKERLLDDFDTQEKVLKDVLMFDVKRKNSLSRNYKLYKLLQRQGISTNKIKLPKCIENNEVVMKIVWGKLKWDWIETYE